ncbi:MAG: TonB-dependent receptor [Bacteroidota bacterium]
MCQIKRISLSISLVLISFYSFSQQNYTISGYVKDAGTGEELLGVTLFVEEIKNGVVSNPYGFYSITLPEGEYNLTLSFIGYETLKKKIKLSQNQSLNLQLSESTTQLQEVVVEAEEEDHNVKDLSIGKSEINIVQVKNLPALFGEPDIIKMVQMQPGVLTAGEGTSAFFVRGGSADQNMILLDEAPVYDPSHLFGLFSVFNADVIKSSELYRGGIPAQYGGRLSSLLDVRTKDGNTNRLSGAGSIGTLASKIMLEGPIVRDKSSFIISGRRSYADLIAKAVGQSIPVYFYDLNAKVNWKPNNKNRFFLAAYLGRDVINFDDGGIGWGNKTTTFRWNHLFSERLFSNTTFAFSDFDYKISLDDDTQGFEWTASMQEATLKKDLTFFLNPKNEISFGASATYRRFSPGRIVPKGDRSIFTTVQLDKMYAMDYAFYLGNTQQITDRFSVQYGLRYSIFQNTGKADVKIYEDPTDNVDINVLEVRKYDRFEPIKTFHNLEPRFSARYTLNDASSLKASYQRMIQNIHLIANSTVPIPFNTWAPSSLYLDPQKSDQISVGYFRNFVSNTYEFSTEIYYKEMMNVTDFADNAQLFFNEDLATEYRQGDSDSYGIEFNVKKNEGRLTGFANYTWSKTTRVVPDVNQGMEFLSNFDRRHSFNIAATYQLSERYMLGANFVYYTGRPITLPTGRYEFDGYNVDLISERNGYKLSDFHRLDISVTREGKKNSTRKWKTSQNLGIYNVYNRRNPFTIYSRTRQNDDGDVIGDGSEKELRRVSLFPILISYAWRVRF